MFLIYFGTSWPKKQLIGTYLYCRIGVKLWARANFLLESLFDVLF